MEFIIPKCTLKLPFLRFSIIDATGSTVLQDSAVDPDPHYSLMEIVLLIRIRTTRSWIRGSDLKMKRKQPLEAIFN
jgi:hypothetical protein